MLIADVHIGLATDRASSNSRLSKSNGYQRKWNIRHFRLFRNWATFNPGFESVTEMDTDVSN